MNWTILIGFGDVCIGMVERVHFIPVKGVIKISRIGAGRYISTATIRENINGRKAYEALQDAVFRVTDGHYVILTVSSTIQNDIQRNEERPGIIVDSIESIIVPEGMMDGVIREINRSKVLSEIKMRIIGISMKYEVMDWKDPKGFIIPAMRFFWY